MAQAPQFCNSAWQPLNHGQLGIQGLQLLQVAQFLWKLFNESGTDAEILQIVKIGQ